MSSEEMAFECYRQYLTIGRHFKSQTGYSEKSLNKVTPGSFARRRDKLIFLTVAKKYPDYKDLFIGSCVKSLGNMPWIGNIDERAIVDYSNARKMVRESIDVFFEKDVYTVINEAKTRDVGVWMSEGLSKNKVPLAAKLAIGQIISPETFIILTEICGGFKVYIDNECDGILWPIWIRTMYRYSDFISFDKKEKIEHLKRLIKT